MAFQTHVFRNFGRNVEFSPRHAFAPSNEDELLQILRDHRGARIRAIGRMHSWSSAVVAEDVLLDMRHFDHVQVERVQVDQVESEWWATAGAGCQIKRLLSELQRLADLTTPTLGLITEQSIAGAAATATHGSGRHCWSHYLAEIRIAHYDAHGNPTISTIGEGPELEAARCGLGCLGIVVSVRFRCRPAYRVEEHLHEYATLDEVLAAELEFPLQQFYLIPWRWRYLGQHRRETTAPRSWFARAYRWYWFLTIDLGLHLSILLLVRICRSRSLIKVFFSRLASPAVIKNWTVVDRSEDMLVMEHELFRHIETEIFVRSSQLASAMDFVREILQHCGGDRDALSVSTRRRLAEQGLLDDALKLAGTYTHHYVICVRKILADDALISMTGGGDEHYYSISLISYARPAERAGFLATSDLLVRSMAKSFGARPHWGKYCPLDRELVRALYPSVAEFAAIARKLDPDGAFRNRWLDDLIFDERSDVAPR